MNEQVTSYVERLAISSIDADAMLQEFEDERRHRQKRHTESANILKNEDPGD